MQRPMKRLLLGALVAAFIVALPAAHLVIAGPPTTTICHLAAPSPPALPRGSFSRKTL